MTIATGPGKSVFLQVNQTDLLAGTSQYFIAPMDGHVSGIGAVAQVAVTTGGTIKVTKGSTDVVGAVVTVANADAAGTKYAASSTKGSSTSKVTKGDVLHLTVDTAFATAGAVNVQVYFEPGDPTFDHVI